MSFSGGVFSINTSGQPVVAGTTISASVFNALTADLATGLSTCMLKDGTQTATAGIGFYAGTVSLPGIYFGTDTATGFYRIGLNNTGFAINGTKLLDLASTSVGITGSLTVSTLTSGRIPLVSTAGLFADSSTITYSAGTITLSGLISNGNVVAHASTAIPSGGTTGSGIKVSSATNFGVFFGSSAPGLSAAKGSLYLRSDGTGTNDRAYINTDGSNTWTALVTVA